MRILRNMISPNNNEQQIWPLKKNKAVSNEFNKKKKYFEFDELYKLEMENLAYLSVFNLNLWEN